MLVSAFSWLPLEFSPNRIHVLFGDVRIRFSPLFIHLCCLVRNSDLFLIFILIFNF
jgi:hypothetical protein